MQRFYDLSKKELNELTDEDVKRFIDIEIAYAGIIPVESPKPISINNVSIQPTVEAFEVFGVIFKNSEDAIKVAGMEVLETSYDYSGSGYDYKWLEPRNKSYSSSAGVKSEKYYKKSDIEAVKKELTENKRMKSRYDEQLKEYEKFSEKTSKISQEIWEKVYEAQRFYRGIESGVNLYRKYVTLANGEKEIALSFIKEAYKNDEETLTELLNVLQQSEV